MMSVCVNYVHSINVFLCNICMSKAYMHCCGLQFTDNFIVGLPFDPLACNC